MMSPYLGKASVVQGGPGTAAQDWMQQQVNNAAREKPVIKAQRQCIGCGSWGRGHCEYCGINVRTE